MRECPKCGTPLVEPAGPKGAIALLVGDSPGVVEKVQGKPFVGKTGEILRIELQRVGLSLDEFRLTNLWGHDPMPAEESYHLRALIKEANRHKLVLLMGSDVVRKMTGLNVSEVSGMSVRSRYIGRGTKLMASFNPAIVFKEGSTVGELRLAIERFAQQYRKLQ